MAGGGVSAVQHFLAELIRTPGLLVGRRHVELLDHPGGPIHDLDGRISAIEPSQSSTVPIERLDVALMKKGEKVLSMSVAWPCAPPKG